MSRARVAQAFQAMKDIGISSKAVKPVLKNLLQLYDNNWELIEEENYRALADAIFEYEDSKVHHFITEIIVDCSCFPFLYILSDLTVSLSGTGSKKYYT